MKLFTVEEVALQLQLDEQTIRRWLQSGKLRGIKISETAWRIKEEDLQDFLKNAAK